MLKKTIILLALLVIPSISFADQGGENPAQATYDIPSETMRLKCHYATASITKAMKVAIKKIYQGMEGIRSVRVKVRATTRPKANETMELSSVLQGLEFVRSGDGLSEITFDGDMEYAGLNICPTKDLELSLIVRYKDNGERVTHQGSYSTTISGILK